jgi:hypothetical protein
MGISSGVRAARREGRARLLRPLGDKGPHLGGSHLAARKVRYFGGRMLLEGPERDSGGNAPAGRAFTLDRRRRRVPRSHTYLTPKEWKIGHMGDALRLFADYC